MKNQLFNLKAVQTGAQKSEVEGGAVTNSFGSATLIRYLRFLTDLKEETQPRK
jgi:hypothetical protein